MRLRLRSSIAGNAFSRMNCELRKLGETRSTAMSAASRASRIACGQSSPWGMFSSLQAATSLSCSRTASWARSRSSHSRSLWL